MDALRPGDADGAAPTLPRTPGLDGIRALAVLAVMAYHNGFSWIPGGFYGVDAFFVLSGYLITSLLLTEWESSGTVRLTRFWARRARRLLPALFVVVAVVGLLRLAAPSALAWPDAVPDALATLLYVANWHFIASGAGYFAASAPPSPLLHTWSLAIEEQFYLVWPLVIVGVLGRRGRRPAADHRRRLQVLGALCVAGGLASAVLMWALTPTGASLERAYYGTDTRAQALLVGGALAVALALYRRRPAGLRRLGAVTGVAGLVASAAVWHWVAETSSLAFHGGFLLASLAAGAVVAGVVLSPTGPASRALALGPLGYLGRISYGVYLWYWPVLLVMTGSRLEMGAWPLFLCRSAVTVALAAGSYHLVEAPIRRGAPSGWRAAVGAPAAAGLSFALVAWSAAVLAPAAGPVAAARVHAARPRPAAVRVLLVGDSMAGSLGATLAGPAPGYGVALINEGHPGCALTTDGEFQFLLYRNPPGPPCKMGDPAALLGAWRRYVAEYRPQVVVYLARADLFNQDLGGTWTWIGHPAFDRFLESQLERGARVLTSAGARLVLVTSPYYNSTVVGGPSVPEDQPDRVLDYDRILRQVARSVPSVTVYPLGGLVDPGGTYRATVDGVAMRCADDVHLSTTAGRVIAPKLLPVLARLGRADRLARAVHLSGPLPPLPPDVPSWYGELRCGR